MEPVKKILAPTDLSDLSSAGLRYALEMGRSCSAEVIVYHVIDLGDHWIKREYSGPVREMLERHRLYAGQISMGKVRRGDESNRSPTGG